MAYDTPLSLVLLALQCEGGMSRMDAGLKKDPAGQGHSRRPWEPTLSRSSPPRGAPARTTRHRLGFPPPFRLPDAQRFVMGQEGPRVAR